MAVRLRYLPLSALTPGMALGRPLVITDRGRITLRLPAGHLLTEPGLEQLLAHHAEYACVEVEDPRTDEARQADEEKQEARLREIFRFADPDSPEIAAFFNALLAYRKL
ncbi:hypothetical protein SAMN05660284_00349 [Formivibrio citricus]|uniref:Uncharacterized protein n=1 Tax=Formivibrio citricus TaxID=83765 RepID=A0A1I4VRW6_9NEIS|nr:hypothetical protein [Formivibrio citricus]SFN03913.1 hypothetical protein SAMN05660284_00349 [Formivibrio citricus]